MNMASVTKWVFSTFIALNDMQLNSYSGYEEKINVLLGLFSPILFVQSRQNSGILPMVKT